MSLGRPRTVCDVRDSIEDDVLVTAGGHEVLSSDTPVERSELSRIVRESTPSFTVVLSVYQL